MKNKTEDKDIEGKKIKGWAVMPEDLNCVSYIWQGKFDSYVSYAIFKTKTTAMIYKKELDENDTGQKLVVRKIKITL